MKTLFALVLALPLLAANPPGFEHWRGANLRADGKKMAAKMDPKLKLAMQQLGKFGNHSFMVAHREASGEAELHETQADIFIVVGGAATLQVGGEVVGGKTTAPGEIRGVSIQGGQKTKMAPGDVLHIPAKTPHQVLVEAGGEFTYMIVKVDTP